ncbi:NAD(P)/FAD-dependent oxidoreductase [Leptolyngbya sp. NIES-2104]|uniref:NAD(P)/FAD-dependent oxidoreductase n=1 Tax=Leptolyngbya sp. NIES-2104 TaxID=1552121 RepID=UPI0006ECA641|nr:FAD-dependent oxidoreductase [Leptolyngbya sp. NIES-2104]GAP99506.1 pyridine nucleotide-disulfide oxidoreductase [Leptolyngbya sp. NIES-2104]
MTHLLIIGGSDAGISAALRSRELDTAVEITIVLADSFPNYSICGLPFYLSGEVSDWHNLAHRKAEDIARRGIRLLMNHWAEAIDPARKIVTVKTPNGQHQTMPYDKLIIGTGGTSVSPSISGLDLPGVYPLRWMTDSFAVQKHLTEQAPQHAVIVLCHCSGRPTIKLQNFTLSECARNDVHTRCLIPSLEAQHG